MKLRLHNMCMPNAYQAVVSCISNIWGVWKADFRGKAPRTIYIRSKSCSSLRCIHPDQLYSTAPCKGAQLGKVAVVRKNKSTYHRHCPGSLQAVPNAGSWLRTTQMRPKPDWELYAMSPCSSTGRSMQNKHCHQIVLAQGP